ncbi:hypothetical protein [Ochrobactrum sp. BTU2]|uniref:hypothetical protein n=1 Tax=Ochrobactrum sp. BTU2 TaxID=2856166 RepID=UPI00211A3941|nr:hypothetical protein [Ochrobactrum sp. BTU2]MCQ9148448.1 hypothetical protein [Ochrobactrum sp. BTU2]
MLDGLIDCVSSAYRAPTIKQMVADFAYEWLNGIPAALSLKPRKFQFSVVQILGARQANFCNTAVWTVKWGALHGGRSPQCLTFCQLGGILDTRTSSRVSLKVPVTFSFPRIFTELR